MKEEIPQQSYRFNNPKNITEWEEYCQDLDKFLLEREYQFWLDTKKFFHLKEDEISSVTCYPNPIRQGGKLNLQITADDNCTIWISVYDLNGRYTYGQYFFLQQGDNTVQLNMEFHSGVYFIKTGPFTKKVIVINP